MDIREQLEQYTKYAQGDLSKACRLKFEDTRFQDMDFSKYDLNNSEFLGAAFLDCNFKGVYLSGSSFCGSLIQGGAFQENILHKATWDYITVRDATILKLDAFRASFYEGNFQKVIFSNCRIEKCGFSNSMFENVTFLDCDLSLTNFNHTSFQNVLFRHCILNHTSFIGVSLNADISFEEITFISNGETLTGLGNNIKPLLRRQ